MRTDFNPQNLAKLFCMLRTDVTRTRKKILTYKIKLLTTAVNKNLYKISEFFRLILVIFIFQLALILLKMKFMEKNQN